jgi:hypothetical protein
MCFLADGIKCLEERSVFIHIDTVKMEAVYSSVAVHSSERRLPPTRILGIITEKITV